MRRWTGSRYCKKAKEIAARLLFEKGLNYVFCSDAIRGISLQFPEREALLKDRLEEYNSSS